MIENNIDYIKTVKLQENGYLINGSMSVPKAESNRHYKDVKVWLESNTPEPEFTEAELEAKEINEKLAEAKQYLLDTDFKVLPDYDQDSTEVKVKRQEAREFIRANEGDNV